MIKSKFAQAPFATKIVLIFFIALVGLFCSSIIMVACSQNMDNILVMKWLQILQTVFTFVLPAFFLAYILDSGVTYLKFTSIRSFPIWVILLFLMPIALPAVNFFKALNDLILLPDFMRGLEAWMQQMENQSQVVTEQFLSVSTISGLLFNILVMAIVPAVGEELFFRGILQTVLGEKMNRHYAVWITAFIFSAIHLQFYGFLPRLLLGAVLGYLFLFTGSIWAPIAAHFINNMLAVILFFLTFNGYLEFNIDTIGTDETWWLGIVSVGFIFLLFGRLKRLKE